MPSVQVKHVPEDVHAALRRRAAESGQSLQEYLLGLLTRAASRPTLDEVLDRVERRSGGRAPFADAVEAVHAVREEA
ncbi:MAG TPA: hypothetical protein ENI86_04295 [Acidimicrobiales bacterium]|nr:hypothetical protein [Acidimicrobiales bacterium]